MNKIKNRFIKLYKDDSGSAIVMVIIALAFIAILGVTIMWMSLSNFRMKATDQKNKQGFYTAETVFEQIKMGLQSDASEAANVAYSYVMQNYSDWDEARRETEFKRMFKRSLIKLVSEDDTGMSTTFEVGHLSRYVNDNLNISTDVDHPGNPIRYLGARRSGSLGQTGDIEGTSGGGGGSETGYIVLKDIVLQYTDDDGFYSEINTDIMISAPDTSFIDSSSLPPIFKYAIIGDEGIDVGTGSLTVNGGLYAGSDGLRVKTVMNIGNADYIISKGPLEAEKDSKVKVTSSVSNNSVLYASEISVDQAKLDIDADTRVADDLNIKGNGTGSDRYVKLSNKYFGFGNDSFNNNNSSAIVINGLNTDLDMSGLNKLVLAGRSFVATGSARSQIKTGEADPGEPVDVSGNRVHVYDNNYNVKMGESIAVKGNQIAYLVPTECIAVGSKTVKGKNPMTWSELATFTREKLTDNPSLEIVNYNTTSVSWLDGNTLDFFMPASDDSYIQKVFAPSNGEVLCYFYVVLDEHKMINTPGGRVDAASAYAQMYYDSHNTKLDRYMDVYAPDVKLPTSGTVTAAATLISSEGRDGAKQHLIANGLSTEDNSNCDFYRSAFKGYCWDLTGNAISASDEATLSSNNLVFEHTIVSQNSIGDPVTNLKDFLDDATIIDHEFVVPAGQPNEGKKAIIVDDSDTTNASVTEIDSNGNPSTGTKQVYVYNDSSDDVRIIISKVDVLLKTNFNGMIITDGKIYIDNGITVSGIENDPRMKEQIISVLGTKYDNSLVWDKTVPASWRPIDFFKDGATYMGTSDSGSGTGSVDIDSSVNYRNWIKY